MHKVLHRAGVSGTGGSKTTPGVGCSWLCLLLLLLLVGFGCLEPLPCLVRKHRAISSFAKGKGVGTLLLRSSEAAMEANAPIWLSKAHPALAHLLLLLLFLPDHNLLNSFPGRQRTDSFPVEPGRRGII